MGKTIEASIEPRVFVRKGRVLLLAEYTDEKHVDLFLRLSKNKVRWDDIKDIPEARIKWDMGFFAEREGKVIIGGRSGGFLFPGDFEMPIVRAKTMELLRERYPNKIFVEAEQEEVEKWREFRRKF